MDPNPLNQARPAPARFNIADGIALAMVAAYILVRLLRLAGVVVPGGGLWLILFGVALAYLLFFRGFSWARAHLPWRLRNRLIVAYLLIAVVPLLLILVMATLSLYLLYWHFGAYLLYADIQQRLEQVSETAETVATSYAIEAASTGNPVASLEGQTPPHTALFLAAERENLPGLTIDVGSGADLLQRVPGRRPREFKGLVVRDGKLELCAVMARRLAGQELLVTISVPVSPQFLATLEPEMGPVQIDVLGEAGPAASRGAVYRVASRTFVRTARIQAPDRTVPPAAHWFDYSVTGYTRLQAVNAASAADPKSDVYVLARFTTRASRLNTWLLDVVGEWAGFAVTAWLVVGGVFLVIQMAALAMGIALTRNITNTVDELHSATQRVRSGDLTHRVEVKQRDQLGDLGESFNTMTASVADLIEEHSRRERLENELTIAREVQAQLFPRERPKVPGVEVEAICRPARIVSGDYYDFLPLGPARLGMALADISGKGISAALIMASLQAALRSQTLMGQQAPGHTAEVVARLNQHLFRSTSEERYATLFYGVYDAAARTLEYTNAGHPPPLYLVGQETRRLTAGGTVLGLFSDCPYEQETISISPQSLLVMFSDGVTESENAAGQEFGEKRLLEVVQRNRHASAHEVLQALVAAAEAWTGTAEQTDDFTIMVARFLPS
jgi:phosphoserine phosphatase RsbU/P